MLSKEELGLRLKKIRNDAGKTQENIASHLGLSKYHISDLEHGRHRVTTDILLGYCEITGLTPNDILGIQNNEDNIIPELKEAISKKSIEDQERILRIINAI